MAGRPQPGPARGLRDSCQRSGAAARAGRSQHRALARGQLGSRRIAPTLSRPGGPFVRASATLCRPRPGRWCRATGPGRLQRRVNPNAPGRPGRLAKDRLSTAVRQSDRRRRDALRGRPTHARVDFARRQRVRPMGGKCRHRRTRPGADEPDPRRRSCARPARRSQRPAADDVSGRPTSLAPGQSPTSLRRTA